MSSELGCIRLCTLMVVYECLLKWVFTTCYIRNTDEGVIIDVFAALFWYAGYFMQRVLCRGGVELRVMGSVCAQTR